jgi:hypothetical protein
MMNAYLVSFVIKHPTDSGQVVHNQFVVAEDDMAAKQRAGEKIAEVISGMSIRGFQIVDETIQPIGQEFIEEAAIKILGWKPPTS